MKTKLVLIPTILLSTANCAMTYKAPKGENKVIKQYHNQSQSTIFRKAKRVLAIEGLNISYSDKKDGLITTNYQNNKVTPSEADCGKTMGLDYLKDKRTKTEVSYNIIIDQKYITAKANIKGEYRPNNLFGDQNITLTCISKGHLEKVLLNKILN